MAPSHQQTDQQLDLFSSHTFAMKTPLPEAAVRPTDGGGGASTTLRLSWLSPTQSFSDGGRRGGGGGGGSRGACGRFKGFGLHRAVPEQVVALQALAAIGGRAAAAAVTQLLIAGAVRDRV